MKVDWDVIEQEAESTLVEEPKAHAHVHAALPHESRHEEGMISLEVLGYHESYKSDARANEEADDLARGPRLMDASHLDRARKADQRSKHEEDADRIQVGQLLPERQRPRAAGADGGRRRVEQEQDDGGRDGRDGQVDVEAPAPRRPLRKCAAEDGAQDAGEAVHRVDEARECGPEPRADGDAQDGVPACCDPGGAGA